jgi:hypothetical protein
MDLARPVMSIKMDKSNLLGLVDNFAGLFASYQASRKTGVPVHFTNYEELDYDGADAVAKLLEKDSLVIVVDTILEKDINGKCASITNAYNVDEFWTELKETFGKDVHFIDGKFEQKEDETWIYGNKYNLRTFYLGLPIPGDYYHSTELSVKLETIDKVTDIIVRLIQYFGALSCD